MSYHVDHRRRRRPPLTRETPGLTRMATRTSHHDPMGDDSGLPTAPVVAGARGRQPRLTTRMEWMITLRCACLTLGATPAEVIGSMSLTACIADTPDAAWPPLRLAHRIAEEYDVCSRGRREGQYVTVQLFRRAPDDDQARLSGHRERSGPPGGVARARTVALAGTSLVGRILGFVVLSLVKFRSRYVVDDEPRTAVR